MWPLQFQPSHLVPECSTKEEQVCLLLNKAPFKKLFWRPCDFHLFLTGHFYLPVSLGSLVVFSWSHRHSPKWKKGTMDHGLDQQSASKASCDPRLCLSHLLWALRASSPSLTISLITLSCHCLSPQPDGQLCGGGHRAWLEYKAQSFRLHHTGMRERRRHLSREISRSQHASKNINFLIRCKIWFGSSEIGEEALAINRGDTKV